MVCRTPKTLFGVLNYLFLIHSFSTLVITLFTIALIKCSFRLYSTFYLVFFFHKNTFGFSCTCCLLNTLKSSSNHGVHEALLAFLLSVYVTRNTAEVSTLCINSLTPGFAKPELSALLRDFTWLSKLKLISFLILI